MLPECENILKLQQTSSDSSQMYQNFASRIEDFNAGRVDMIIDLLDVRTPKVDVTRILHHATNLNSEVLNSYGHLHTNVEDQ